LAVVKKHEPFSSNPILTENPENADISDAAHRNYSNYADHLFNFPNFTVLSEQDMKDHITSIEQDDNIDPLIPNKNNWPDVRSVQRVAYRRIVIFRQFLDSVIGPSNRFWGVHRNPAWISDIISFWMDDRIGLHSEKIRESF